MRVYGHAQIADAFRSLDRVATSRRRIIVIGGAAVAIHTKTSTGTMDIDHDPPPIDDLIDECIARGIELPPFSAVTIADYPYFYEDRLVRVFPELEQLNVFILEPHDLVLSKIIRWFEGDEADVRELHAAAPLSNHVLVERYAKEMTHVLGSRTRIDANFIECIDALFGEIAADQAREELRR